MEKITLNMAQFEQLVADVDAMSGLTEALETLQCGMWSVSQEEMELTTSRLLRVQQVFQLHLLQLATELDPRSDETELPFLPEEMKPYLSRQRKATMDKEAVCKNMM